uniref:Uncharacterized protein n=1 Tax=Knipowitschia caucasica TaxID=637954 RepID=A0AAV2KXL9_KNICA
MRKSAIQREPAGRLLHRHGLTSVRLGYIPPGCAHPPPTRMRGTFTHNHKVPSPCVKDVRGGCACPRCVDCRLECVEIVLLSTRSTWLWLEDTRHLAATVGTGASK